MATSKTRIGLIGALAAAATISGVVFLTSSSDINVPVGGDVQAAINTAAADCSSPRTIVLEAGQAYKGNVVLPNNQCTDFITIKSSRADELPENQRVNPSQSALFARLQSTVNAEPVVKTAPGAHHYKFIGIQFETRDEGVFVYDLVRFGEGRGEQKTIDAVPHHLVVDRSYIHGWPTQDVQRGVGVNSANTDITNSYISDIHGVGFDTQAVAGWNGTNTVRLINSYLEAAGENVLFGGADSASVELMPANIEIRRNYLFKPLSWQVGHPTYAGKHWTVKNLLELKAAKNVVIDGNLMENNWTDGQAGVGVLFTVRNQECSNPWSTVQNVTYSNNTVKGSDGGALNLLGKDNEAELAYGKCKDPATIGSVRGSGVTITNSLFYDIGGAFLTLNGFDDVSINRTTHLQRGNITTIYGQPSQGFKYMNNLTIDGPYGFWTEAGIGVAGLNKLVPGAMIEANVVVAPYDKGAYPPNNQYPVSLTLPSDLRSPFPAAGCDIDALLVAQIGTGTGGPTPAPSVASPSPTVVPSPSPTPSPTPVPTIAPPPLPPPSPSPSPTATQAPSPSPTATILPFCRPGERPGSPPRCRCARGFQGSSGKCR